MSAAHFDFKETSGVLNMGQEFRILDLENLSYTTRAPTLQVLDNRKPETLNQAEAPELCRLLW